MVCINLLFILVCSEPGAPPENLKGQYKSSTSILVTWDEVPKDQQHGHIRSYTVFYKKSNGGEEKNEKVSSPSPQVPPARQVVLKDLTEFTNYSIQVLASTFIGGGPRSDTIRVSTDEDSKCKQLC